MLALARELGVATNGTFVELGGHNGLMASNTIFTEACRGWRGLLIEANPASFEQLRLNRPGVLAAYGAVCSHRGHATFAARRSLGLSRRNVTKMSIDETGGVEQLMSRTFERAGYGTTAPTAWLNTSRALRIPVPCAPLHDYLALFKLRRIDAFWLDVRQPLSIPRPL